jgi:chemotaxis protein methyltransferase CheR
MKDAELRPDQLSQLGGLIARTIGLNFPREHWDDLRRGMTGAAHEFGFHDVGACVTWLLARPLTQAQLQVLAAHLTIGETYFFREPQTLNALATNVLPELIRARSGERRLRIWSAACCNGEEPYSLAILLHEALPDLDDWDVTITATDINARALRKATAGSYGEWSFRNAPAGLKERYFNRTANGRYVVAPHIRKLVTFAYLNLVDDAYPSLATGAGAGAIDLIFCRNVLMYFTPSQIGKVIGNLRHMLAEGGWLVVSPSEASHSLFAEFATENFPGAILYRKSAAMPLAQQQWAAPPAGQAIEPVARPAEIPVLPEPTAPAATLAVPPEPAPAPVAVAESLYRQGRHAETAETLLASLAQHAPGPQAFALLARALANQGQLADALTWCERWIAADKLDSAGQYLRAVILLELAQPDQARSCLQRAIYLDPDFVLAHFALGNLARSCGKPVAADKHFANALALLRTRPADELVRESDGLSARRLTETIASMLAAAPPS